ncbi:hypothetical protein G9A89_003978 [Geosiphon pyriformis]|nr:hypothetical protein G9A89_003978 [Geosiphon pyriformis]
MSPQQHLLALSNDFWNLFNTQKFSDVNIIVGEEPNIKTFHAHSQILAAKSPYFAIALSMPTILELLVTADELILENLIDTIEDYLIEHHPKELEKSFATLHNISFMHDSFKKSKKFCTEIAANNPAIIFNSQDFTSLSENFLSSILTRNDLNMEESKIWEKIVEWGVAKLDKNFQMEKVLYWTDENFNVFKESVERLLPLIRFFNISAVYFYHKVKPFARILPGTLCEDLLHHYLVPGSQQKSVDAQPSRFCHLNTDSRPLESQDIKRLDRWIQGKNRNAVFETQLGNDFNLLLRGSRDGFTPADFHRLCDNKGATVSVIKVKGTGQLIGGYNPQSWYSRGSWLDGEGSFIFTLGDGNIKLSRYVGECGPYGNLNYGPYFEVVVLYSVAMILEVVVLYWVAKILKIDQGAIVKRQEIMSIL